MIQRPLILGAKGTMGRRYAAIFRAAGITPLLADAGDIAPRDFDSVLIATPTALHAAHIEQFIPTGVPILVEKPLTTSLRVLERIVNLIDQKNAKVDMVNQYRYLSGLPTDSDLTVYDYFNHGRDGLFWDCISIIALANGEIALREESPVWRCQINGQTMNLADMDRAYIAMIDKWVNGKLKGHDATYIRDAHAKVMARMEVH